MLRMLIRKLIFLKRTNLSTSLVKRSQLMIKEMMLAAFLRKLKCTLVFTLSKQHFVPSKVLNTCTMRCKLKANNWNSSMLQLGSLFLLIIALKLKFTTSRSHARKLLFQTKRTIITRNLCKTESWSKRRRPKRLWHHLWDLPVQLLRNLPGIALKFFSHSKTPL